MIVGLVYKDIYILLYIGVCEYLMSTNAFVGLISLIFIWKFS